MLTYLPTYLPTYLHTYLPAGMGACTGTMPVHVQQELLLMIHVQELQRNSKLTSDLFELSLSCG